MRHVSAVLLTACLPLALHATGNDWPSRDGDPGGQRYSSLKQITPANVAQLTTAWTFDTGSPALQVTPLVVGGVMYVGAGSTVYALEPETGTIVWKAQFPTAVSRRGVAYWSGSAGNAPRIVFGAGDRLVAIDAKTGAAIPSFGDNGSVDMCRTCTTGRPVVRHARSNLEVRSSRDGLLRRPHRGSSKPTWRSTTSRVVPYDSTESMAPR
jgi:quinoprotein glucose dehydrogenase